jgi:hypothetical protein
MLKVFGSQFTLLPFSVSNEGFIPYLHRYPFGIAGGAERPMASLPSRGFGWSRLDPTAHLARHTPPKNAL